MSEELKNLKQTLLSAIQGQMGNLDKVNAEELGEVIDMIKDLEEAEYYCAVTKAMEENKKEKEEGEKIANMMGRNQQYYTPYMKYLDPRYNDNPSYPSTNRMWYGGSNSNTNNSNMSNGNNTRGYYEYNPMEMRDYREGRSPMSRKGYIESKEMHQDSSTQLNKLEKYINELSNDIVEMTSDSSPEEKSMLHQKLITLANKIQ